MVTHTHTHEHACADAHTLTHTQTHTNECACSHTQSHAPTHTRMSACAHTHTHTHTNTHTPTHTYTHTHQHTHAPTHTHKHTHTHTHTHTSYLVPRPFIRVLNADPVESLISCIRQMSYLLIICKSSNTTLNSGNNGKNKERSILNIKLPLKYLSILVTHKFDFHCYILAKMKLWTVKGDLHSSFYNF